MDSNAETSTVKRLLTRVAVVSRPDPQWWVQAYQHPEFRTEEIAIIEYAKDRRLYAVAPKFKETLKRFYRKHYLFVGATGGGAIFIWVIKMAGEDGVWNKFPMTMYDCAGVCMRNGWHQIVTGPHGYEAIPPDGYKEPPPWAEWLHPCTCLDDLIELAFKQTYIDREDHPVYVDLLGK